MSQKYNLAVCTFPGPGYDPESEAWIKKYIPIWTADERINRVIPLRLSDTPISMCRNNLAARAKEEGADYILMIDADMKPDCELGEDPTAKPFWESSWEFVMERRENEELDRTCNIDEFGSADDRATFIKFPPATIASPYCSKPPNEVVLVFKWIKHENSHPGLGTKYDMGRFDRDQAARFTGIFEVAALATGLILYDARVFDKLPHPWFEYEYEDFPRNTKKSSSEDVYQTRNASMIGMPQYCNFDAWAGHQKIKTVRKPLLVDVSDIPDALAVAVRDGCRGRIAVKPGSRLIKPASMDEAASASDRERSFWANHPTT